MITLKCPTCAADITLDETRDFGFCSYCGTKILFDKQIKVSQSSEDKLNAELEIVKRLINARMWVDAKAKLSDILKEHPDCAEAWIYDAYVDSMTNLIVIYKYPWNTKEKLINSFYTCFDRAGGSQKALQLMGSQILPVYSSMKAKYQIAVKEKIDQLELSTKQFIQSIQSNNHLLAGYCGRIYHNDDHYDEYAFFEYDGRLLFLYKEAYYTVDSVINGIVSLTFDSFDWIPDKKYNRHMTLQKIDFAENDSILFEGGLHLTRSDKGSAEHSNRYERKIKERSSSSKCSICGGNKVLFFCEKNCQSHIIG